MNEGRRKPPLGRPRPQAALPGPPSLEAGGGGGRSAAGRAPEIRPAPPEEVSDFAAASGVSWWVVAAGEELEREGRCCAGPCWFMRLEFLRNPLGDSNQVNIYSVIKGSL